MPHSRENLQQSFLSVEQCTTGKGEVRCIRFQISIDEVARWLLKAFQIRLSGYSWARLSNTFPRASLFIEASITFLIASRASRKLYIVTLVSSPVL